MELLERTEFLQTLAEYAGEAQRGNGRRADGPAEVP
jgi:hypothetical protein